MILSTKNYLTTTIPCTEDYNGNASNTTTNILCNSFITNNTTLQIICETPNSDTYVTINKIQYLYLNFT